MENRQDYVMSVLIVVMPQSHNQLGFKVISYENCLQRYHTTIGVTLFESLY